MKKKINLSCYDGSEGCEYNIYNDGEVSIYVILILKMIRNYVIKSYLSIGFQLIYILVDQNMRLVI